MQHKLIYILSFACIGLLASACGITGRVTKKKNKEPARHLDVKDIKGKGENIEEGIASWYGPNFHGKLTANGEQYDMYGLTAAHRTLPFNSLVRVENIDNGKSVVVRINDRGPFAKNRIIDLSKKAAREIGMLGPGTAHVKLILLNKTLQNSKTTNLKVATYTVQLGSFDSETGAFEESRKIQGSRVEKALLNNNPVFRVYYGKFIDKDEALKKQQELADMGFNGYVKQIENQ